MPHGIHTVNSCDVHHATGLTFDRRTSKLYTPDRSLDDSADICLTLLHFLLYTIAMAQDYDNIGEISSRYCERLNAHHSKYQRCATT